MEAILPFLFLVLIFVVLPFFFVQAVFNGRSPWSVFSSPIKNREVTVLCSIISKSKVEYGIDVLDKVYRINDGQFVMKRHFVTDQWRLNGFQLSYLQEKRVLKAIHRRMINADLLTPAGQTLFGGREQ